MWKKLKIENIGAIERCVAEFQVWSNNILPYGKMKIKIYERQNGTFLGYTDIRVIRKFDNMPEGAVGHGSSIEEALTDTINYFMQMVKEDYPENEYPNGLSEDNIQYSDFCDF
jgi:hypothetical protein